MILDSSVIVAIVHREPDYRELVDKLAAAEALAIATPNLLESGMVIESRLGVDAEAVLDRFLTDFEVTRIPFGEHHWREALAAYRRYGRRRHPANLNFGDCIAYAAARLAGEPLLFVGDDFAQTDIVAASST